MNVWGCRRRRASVAKARMELFAELIVRTMRRQQRDEPIWTTAKDKSPKIDWSSLLSAVNLVDESGREQDRSQDTWSMIPLCSALVQFFYVHLCLVLININIEISVTGASYSAPNIYPLLRASLRLLTSLSPTLYGFMSSEPKLDAYLDLQTYSAVQSKFTKQALHLVQRYSLNHLFIYSFLHMILVISNNIDDHLPATGFSLPDKINGVGNTLQALWPDT